MLRPGTRSLTGPLLRLAAVVVIVALLAGPRAHAQTTGISADDRALYAAAFHAAKAGQWSKARSLATKASNQLPAKVITWMALKDGAVRIAFAEFADFIAENPHWPELGTLRRRAEGVMDSSLTDERVIAWFRTYPPLTGPGLARLAEAYLNSGREAEGVEFLRRAWVERNFSYWEERSFLMRHGNHLGPGHHIARLDRLLWDGDRRAARRMLRRVDSGHRKLGEARLRLMSRAGGVDRAIAAVPRSLKDDPGLWYERARWRRRKGFHERAREILLDPPANLVRPEAWWAESRIEARRALVDAAVTDAYWLASRHRQTEPLALAEAEWLAGWLALRFLDERENALRHFATLARSVQRPISAARATYWAGRAAEAAGRAKAAGAWYRKAARHPTTFYGQLAAARVGAPEALIFSDPPVPTEADVRAFNELELVNAVRVLAELGQRDLIDPFIRRLSEQAGTPEEHALIAVLAHATDRPDLAVAAAKRASWAGTHFIRYGYPIIPMPPAPGDAPDGVEPALLLAMVRQESAFDARAVSRAGALGLLQVLPATARHVTRRLNLRFSTTRLMRDSAYNLTVGRTYLDELLAAYDGSYALALAAYNAGPGRVERWIDENGDPRTGEVDIVDWIELIPFEETRNYVQRVIEAVAVYRVLLGEAAGVVGLAEDLRRGLKVPSS